MNTLGKIFRISVFGESHGPGIGVLVDGCPPGLAINDEMIMEDIDRRRSGRKGTTARLEYDLPEIVSGVFRGVSTGAPIMIMTRNTNIRPSDYDRYSAVPRPGHADMVARQKYGGYADTRGGGHSSGRLTWGMVVAGSVARLIIKPAQVRAELLSVGGNKDVEAEIESVTAEHDSVGGLIECIATGIPAGLGEPIYYPVESAISQAIFSIPAIKGIEFGSGFRAAEMRGSEHNDPVISKDGKTSSNNAGGINGGISNGNDIVLRVAVKPPSSISKEQWTWNFEKGEMDILKAEGRHDACIALRIPVIAEAAVSIALADLFLVNRAIYGGIE
ncbi:MAG TPA: chorismate synthase [Bacteroidetes bacterium]|nr:chorismate synthase [Bacteroidota bacterium]